ncbi:hypothetical protein F4801DRAFT_194 [Xylaria longipes]|nr:hypothetical protein F4801DRAFT_194 [Xylaria longipes]
MFQETTIIPGHSHLAFSERTYHCAWVVGPFLRLFVHSICYEYYMNSNPEIIGPEHLCKVQPVQHELLSESALFISEVAAVNIALFLLILPSALPIVKTRFHIQQEAIGLGIVRISLVLLATGGILIAFASDICVTIICLAVFAAGFGVRVALLSFATHLVNRTAQGRFYGLIQNNEQWSILATLLPHRRFKAFGILAWDSRINDHIRSRIRGFVSSAYPTVNRQPRYTLRSISELTRAKSSKHSAG